MSLHFLPFEPPLVSISLLLISLGVAFSCLWVPFPLWLPFDDFGDPLPLLRLLFDQCNFGICGVITGEVGFARDMLTC